MVDIPANIYCFLLKYIKKLKVFEVFPKQFSVNFSHQSESTQLKMLWYQYFSGPNVLICSILSLNFRLPLHCLTFSILWIICDKIMSFFIAWIALHFWQTLHLEAITRGCAEFEDKSFNKPTTLTLITANICSPFECRGGYQIMMVIF